MKLPNAAVAPILAMNGAMQLPRAQQVYNVRRCSVSDVYRVMHEVVDGEIIDILFQKIQDLYQVKETKHERKQGCSKQESGSIIRWP
jgi:hypothetical protein